MKRDDVLVVQTLYRTVDVRCQMCTEKLQQAGYKVAKVAGDADITASMNYTLTMALKNIGDNRILVLIDDDMVFKVEDVDNLVSFARESAEPVAGVAVNHDGRVIGTERLPNGLALTGTAFFAIKFSRLESFTSECRVYPYPKGDFAHVEFTWSSSGLSPDFRLCRRLGGARIVPIPVGHLKPVVLYPTEAQVAEVVS